MVDLSDKYKIHNNIVGLKNVTEKQVFNFDFHLMIRHFKKFLS